MSFPRSRIPVRFLRVLLSINPSAYQQSKGLSCEGISNTQFCYSSWRLLPIAQGILALLGFGQDTFFWTITKLEEQCLLESTLGSFEIKRMASSVSPLHVEEKSNGSGHMSIKTAKVVFVLGGPGSGKGTQCALIVEHFGFTHLSAGDLLRAEINSGNENGVMIQSMIKEGKIVPSEVTVRLLQKAMLTSNNDKFLIDGFPRNDENRAAFEHVTGIKPEFILFFDCTEKEMEKRILGRNQGRVDDNIETIRKRFKVFAESSLPVISHYESFGKVWKIDADRTRDEVFESIRPLFAPFLKETA